MSKGRFFLLFLFCSAIFAIDFFSKSFVSTHFRDIAISSARFPYGGIPVFYNFFGIDFSINHVTNRGAAWGMFTSFNHILPFLRLGIITLLIAFLFFRQHSRIRSFALAAIIVGALGNVVDSFRFGHVIDMFHFVFWNYSFPVFNIADSAIFCGVVLLLFTSKKPKKIEQQAES